MALALERRGCVVNHDRRMALAGIVSVLAASAPLATLTADRAVFFQAGLFVAGLFLLGMVLRAARLPHALATSAMAIGWAAYAGATLSTVQTGLPWPERLPAVFADAVNHISSEAAPMSENLAVRFFLVLLIGLIAILYDLCAISCNTAGSALLPLSSFFLIAALALRQDVSIWVFLPVAFAFCVTLLAAESSRAREWDVGAPGDARESRSAARMGLPLVAAAGTLALTLLVGLVLPPFSAAFRPATGSGPLVLTDPSLDLRRNLTLPADQIVVRYKTDFPGGTYLRMATLSEFSADGWRVGSSTVEYGELPAVPGYTPDTPDRRTSSVKINGFASQWLPLPYAPRQVVTDSGRWGFNPDSLDMVASQPATDGLTYDVTWWNVEPTSTALADAVPGVPPGDDSDLQLPDDLPSSITALGSEITADASSAHAKASAIQAYLRSSRFTYSTDPQPGSGYDALTRFLFTDRTGYCEQFAASFAVLARSVGLPTRVVVGFLPGTLAGDEYQVSIRQMHAWPEVFYDGLGWVRYEPTPSAAAPPGYSLDAPTSAPSEDPTTAPASSTTPSDTPSTEPSATPTEVQPSTPPATTVGPWPAGIAIGGGILGALLLISLPGLVRGRRRSRRLALADGGSQGEGAEAAWAELRDTVIDFGRPWPSGSPRQIADALGKEMPDAQEAALRTLADAVERARFAAHPPNGEELAAPTRVILNQLRTWATRAQRARARVLPRSLWHQSRG